MNEKFRFIKEFITSYSFKIRQLNQLGYYDEAKLFEYFAQQICQLLFNQPFSNLNEIRSNYPYIDLLSDDRKIGIQVSTTTGKTEKIQDTLRDIRDSNDEKLNSLNRVVFFFLGDDPSMKVSPTRKTETGKFDFDPKQDIITTQSIVEKASSDADFCSKLYDFLLEQSKSVEKEAGALETALKESKVILDSLTDKIGQHGEINRSDLINKILSEKNKNIVVEGEAGSGKTVLCKKLAQNWDKVLFVRAEELMQKGRSNEIWGFSLEDTFRRLGENKLLIVIDSLEFIADNLCKLDMLRLLYDSAEINQNITIVSSCRTSDITPFVSIHEKYHVKSYTVPLLNDEQIRSALKNIPKAKSMATNRSFKDFLRTPFYLNILVESKIDATKIEDVSAFRKQIWDNVMCRSKHETETTIRKMALERAKNLSVGVRKESYQSEEIKDLISRGIIKETDGLIRLKHDIFEDICFEQIIDELFEDVKKNIDSFFSRLTELGPCAGRRYRIWVENKLLGREGRDKFLHKLILGGANRHWQEQTVIGICQSEYCAPFFEEYGDDLTQEPLCRLFFQAINFNAFSISPLRIAEDYPMLIPIGAGREEMLKIIAKDAPKTFDCIEPASIIKATSDLITQGRGESSCQTAAKILTTYIDSEINAAQKEGDLESSPSLFEALKNVFRIPQHCQKWIENLLEQSLDAYSSAGDKPSRRFAADVLRLTLSIDGGMLFVYLPDLTWKVFVTFFSESEPKKKETLRYSVLPEDPEEKYGLSEEAQEYRRFSNSQAPKSSSGLYLGLKTHFSSFLEKAIAFVNDRVSHFAKREELQRIVIFSPKTKETREYYGSADLWMMLGHERNSPVLMSDLLYFIWLAVDERAKNLDINERREFLEKTKDLILTKSNNITLFPLIAAIGYKYEQELPGFSLDLCSSIDLIFFDYQRVAAESPAITDMEDKLFEAMGIPASMARGRYKGLLMPSDLARYFLNAQCSENDGVKKNCATILSYLRQTIPNSKENAAKYRQIEKMDLANYKFDNSGTTLVPTLSGAAKELAEQPNPEVDCLSDIISRASLLIEAWEKNRSLDLEKLLGTIDDIQKQKGRSMYSLLSQRLIPLLSLALGPGQIGGSKKAELCKIWLEDISPVIANGCWQFYPVLFSQLLKETDQKTKNSIKRFILDALLDPDQLPTMAKVHQEIKFFLAQNSKIASLFINTIVALAEDETAHQKYNMSLLRKRGVLNPDGPEESIFLIPSYKTDPYIDENGWARYPSKTEEIIQEHLYEERGLPMDGGITNCASAQILVFALRCGQGLDDPRIASATEVVTKFFFSLHDLENQMGAFAPSDFSVKSLLVEFLKGELLMGRERADKAFEILFSPKINDSSHAIGEFFFDVFSFLAEAYCLTTDNRERRLRIESQIKELEKRLSSLPNTSTWLEARKCLVFAPPRYASTKRFENLKYDYRSKEFMGTLFEIFGQPYFSEMLKALWRYDYRSMLPEVIVPLSNVVQSIEGKNPNGLRQELLKNHWGNAKFTLLSIVFFAYVHYTKELKSDGDYLKAFLSIVACLRRAGFPEAAVIEDEFLAH